jgi:hypothetical protein
MAAVQRRVDPRWPRSAEQHADPAHRSPEKHLITTGTGRAGTSFLVRYLTELGLDTTLARNGERAGWDLEANAGLENLLVSGTNLPYVVKSPWIGEYVDQILNEKQFKIDAFIVPVRDLVEAATSRVVLEQRAIHQHNPWMADQLDRTWETYGHTAGGLVYSLNPLDQARLLAVQFHQLVLKASEAGIPIVFPVFPRIATDWQYLHKCLRPILPLKITEDVARVTHARVADAAKVRVTGEIVKDGPRNASGNVIYRSELNPGPHYPGPTEIDNIALRREIGRLRQELKQQASAQELCAHTADQLSAQVSALQGAKREFEQERAGLEAAIQGLGRKLDRKSIKYKMRRVFRILNGARSIWA